MLQLNRRNNQFVRLLIQDQLFQCTGRVFFRAAFGSDSLLQTCKTIIHKVSLRRRKRREVPIIHNNGRERHVASIARYVP